MYTLQIVPTEVCFQKKSNIGNLKLQIIPAE